MDNYEMEIGRNDAVHWATAERSVCTNSEIVAFQYWDIDAALRFLLLASTDPRP